MKDILFGRNGKLRARDMTCRKIFIIIFREPGISRTELQSRTTFSKNSITKLVDELLDAGLLAEGEACNGSSCPGRRRIGLFVRPELFYIVSAIFSLEEPEIALVNAAGMVVERHQLQHEGSAQSERFIDEILQKTQQLLSLVDPSLVLGAGIALPGIFDIYSGNVFSSQAFAIQSEAVNCKKMFDDRFGMEIMLYNATNMRAANEKYYGAAKDMDNFVTIDEGLGMGMYMNGKLYRGWQGNGGELGFMKITEGAQPGQDGRCGLLYEKAIFSLIGERIFSVINNGGNIQIDSCWKPNEYLPPKAAVKAVKDGNLFVAQILTELFSYVGDAVVNVAYMLNPQAIFLPAWSNECPQYTLDVVRMKMGSYGLSNWHLKSEVLSAQAENSSRAKTLAKLFVEDLFKDFENHPDFFMPFVKKQ